MSIINDLRDAFAAVKHQVEMEAFNDGSAVFKQDGLYMVVAHRFNQLLGAVMTEYAFNKLLGAHMSLNGKTEMSMAELAWSYGFGHHFIREDDNTPCTAAVWEWDSALSGRYKFAELNRAPFVDQYVRVQYVVHMKHEPRDDEALVFLVGVANSLAELGELNAALRVSNAYDSDCDTVIINPVVKAHFSFDKMVVVE